MVSLHCYAVYGLEKAFIKMERKAINYSKIKKKLDNTVVKHTTDKKPDIFSGVKGCVQYFWGFNNV